MILNFQLGNQGKLKLSKETAEMCGVNKSNVNVASYPKAQICFFNTSQPASLSHDQLLISY